MGNENSVTVRRSWPRRIARGLFIAALALVALSLIGNTIWKFSGSNKWELIGEKNGVKVYSLKSPGTDIAQVKGVVRVRSSLAGLVAFMQDPTVCKKIGCRESYVIERVDDQFMYTTFRFNLPFKFQPREFVLSAHFFQNPRNKEVQLRYAPAPEKLPPNDCCFRVTDMHNTWRFTPVGNGLTDVEFHMKMDDGGFMPDVLINQIRPQVMYKALPRLQKLLDDPKYQQAKFGFITEL